MSGGSSARRTRPTARLTTVALPAFGAPGHNPELGPSIHARRLERLRAAMTRHGLDLVVVYADREHSANLAWLTGFDPRFEEAILIVGPDGEPGLLVGNECWGTAGAAPLPLRRRLHQDLSLPSQPRDASRPLAAVLADEGLRAGARVGVAGWKTYEDPDWLDVPSYLANLVRAAVGGAGRVVNAAPLFIDAADGLRVINEPDQLAVFEAAACRTSSGVRNLLWNVRPGMTEREAVALLGWDGSPLSCHLMLTAGPRAALGLMSPGDRPIERVDPLTVAFGIWGALNCRAGWVVEAAAELPAGSREYVDRLVGPYFEAIAAWYRTLRIGVTGGELHAAIHRRIGDPFFGVRLNPGHQIGLDEWVNSPVRAGSEVVLQSGMYLQVDVIPATGTAYFTTNIEDGVALADEAFRATLAREHPSAWQRIEARRAFMANDLGIDLHPDVLPFSNIPAYLPPFLLRPEQALVMA